MSVYLIHVCIFRGKAFTHQGRKIVATVPEKKIVSVRVSPLVRCATFAQTIDDALQWVGTDQPERPMAVLRAIGEDAGLEVDPDVFHSPGLLEDLVLATVMLCSKKSLGDHNGDNWGATLLHDVLLSVAS